MSTFARINSKHQEFLIETIDGLNAFFSQRVLEAFSSLDLMLKVEPTTKHPYERHVKAKIEKVNFFISSPRGEEPLLMCSFEVKGVDQNGESFSDKLPEHKLGIDLPWDTVVLPEKTPFTSCQSHPIHLS